MNVTLIGVDGAGKSTISKLLIENLPIPTKIIYMGINYEASQYMLPSTWFLLKFIRKLGTKEYQGGPPDPSRAKSRPKGFARRFWFETKAVLRTGNLMMEEWFRQCLAWYFQARGYFVVFDRHFFLDYYTHHIMPQRGAIPVFDRLHGYMLAHVFPKPKFVIFLDAPSGVLLARKGEGTIELLDQRRKEYIVASKEVENFNIVPADKPISDVLDQVVELIMSYYKQDQDKDPLLTDSKRDLS